LIGSDGSTDDTCRVVTALNEPRARVIDFADRRGKPSVLNDLVPQCQSEIVLLADARQLFDPDCIQRLLTHFQDQTVGVVSGELVLRQDSNQSAAATGV